MRGRKHTDDEVAARRSEVETVISTGRWSRDEVRALAHRHGVDTREIYRDRAAVLDEIREAIADPDPANAKLDLLMRARDLYRTCAAVQ